MRGIGNGAAGLSPEVPIGTHLAKNKKQHCRGGGLGRWASCEERLFEDSDQILLMPENPAPKDHIFGTSCGTTFGPLQGARFRIDANLRSIPEIYDGNYCILAEGHGDSLGFFFVRTETKT